MILAVSAHSFTVEINLCYRLFKKLFSHSLAYKGNGRWATSDHAYDAMNSATGGAADPRQADNSTVKQQQRAPSPARFKDASSKTPSKTSSAKSASTKQGGKNGRSSSPVAVSPGKDRQAAKGAAAVHPSGAESPTTIRRAEKAKKIEERHSSTEDADDPPLKTDRVVSDQPSSSKSSQSKVKNQRGKDGAASSAKQPANNTVGCGPGFWREGCLQSELIQFHMNKSLKKEGAMHAKAASSPGNGMEFLPEAPLRPSESNVERDLRDEIETLNDENDNLKVSLYDSKQ